MYCPNCKQEFDGKFCPECGTRLIEKTQRVCPKCNIEVDSNFCPECGTKTVEVVEKIVKMCPNCNIESDSKFCPECGAKIVEMAVKATATGEIVAAGQQEDAETCYQTAQDYQYGKNGKQQDDEAAAQWYLKAAEQGHVESYYCLGSMLKEVCEFEDAFGCFQEAAEQGHAASQYELGVAYSLGFGTEQNDEESMKWYRKAAEQGHEEAIGFLEELGERVPAGGEDGAEKWYLKAAEQGNEEAIEYQKKSLTNMDNKEIFREIFEQYGSMVISVCFGYDTIEATFEEGLKDEVWEATGCMLYQVDYKTLERFNTIAELFITHTDINVNDRQKLALMVLLYVVLWDNVDDSNLKIEYNGEVLIDKPKNEVFEEYKSYLEKIAEYVPAYEPVDSDDEEDEDCDDEWNDDEEDEDWNNDEDDEDIEGYEVKDGIGIIPDGTTAIKSEAFKGREDLISINIPKGVTRIGESAFEDCINLASITIPDSVTEIDDNAINGCTSLENITFPDSLKCISSGLLYCCKNLKNITIPNSITSIGEAAFGECTSLASIKIPNSVTRIEEAAFAECTSLESIEIPNGVTTIGDCIFHSCTSLKSITLPDSVRSIGGGMCYLCKNVKSIKVPAGKGDYFKELLDDEELAKLVVEIR